MKRSSRPPVLEPRPSPRRRALSEDERELWDLVARHVKPLRKLRAAKAHAAPRPEPSAAVPAS
ncbi:DNA mismatch repair protein MutS, partial [Herbaspirillum sp. HC18]